MTKIQAQLEKSIASAKALAKVAGEECDVEKGKPESLIDGAADVQVVDNLPEGVTVPGAKGMEVSGETSEDRGTDIGTVETNGPAPENNTDNPEVEDILSAAEHVTKHANALIAAAKEILAIPETAFAGVAKQASASVTEQDVLDYIVKQANAGDPAMQGIINYCNAFYKAAAVKKLASAKVKKTASDGASVEESANIEAEAAQAKEIVAQAVKEQDPSLSDEEAQAIASEAIAQTLQEGGAEGGAEELDENLVALVGQVAEQVKAEDPSISDEEAADIAIQAISEIAQEGGFEEGGEEAIDKEASAKKEEPAKKPEEENKKAAVEKKAAGEEEVTEAAEEVTPAGTEEVAETEEVPAAEDSAETSVAIQEMAEQLVAELASEVKAEDPSVSDEEAVEIAAEAVEDAMETVQAQQMIGAADEEGNPVVSDEDAAAITEELEKSASAHPCRALLCTAINNHLGLSPEAFAKRIGA